MKTPATGWARCTTNLDRTEHSGFLRTWQAPSRPGLVELGRERDETLQKWAIRSTIDGSAKPKSWCVALRDDFLTPEREGGPVGIFLRVLTGLVFERLSR